MIYTGIVEDRNDDLDSGRAKVRVIGVHTPDKTLLPTSDLPWAIPMNNITSASMNGIGRSPTGLVEGTTVLVVFADEDMQIPVMLGTIAGIPQADNVFVETELSLPEEVVDVSELENKPVAESPELLDPTTLSRSVDSNPGIAALNTAMDDAGITSKYARASILAICQVESNFKPVTENLNYSANALISTFPSSIKNDVEFAKSIERKPQAIGEAVYGVGSARGLELGNTSAGDGYKYRGRGYVQLTGKKNYAKYSDVAGTNLVNNPDALLDPTISAKVTVAYFKDRVKTSQNSPAYFNSAVKAVGLNRQDVLDKKTNAYAYWLGESPTLAQTDKSASYGESSSTRPNMNYGFSDPNSKYPLRSHINEPDTNRLARGKFLGTIVERKDINRVKSVPTSTGKSWNQPASAYNARYPFNKVEESESGHVFEIDDTPDNERIHTYHRSGTFEETDKNGTNVKRIVGDSYEIIDRNGYIYIQGAASLTVAGDIDILAQSNANIKIYGNVKLDVHGNAETNISGNHTTNVGGSYKVKANNIAFESNTHDVLSATYRNSSADMNIKANEYSETVTGKSSYRWEGDRHYYIGADQYERHDFGFDYSCPSDPSRVSDISCDDVDEANNSASTGLGQAISRLNPLNVNFAPLTIPVRNADKEFSYESPDEQEDNTREAIPDAMPENQTAEIESVANSTKSTSVSCDIFYNMAEYPNSLVLHTDSTGYKWTLGALLRGYKLEDRTVNGVSYSKADIVCNLKHLAENVLSKINEKVGRVGKAWTITSCYRDRSVKGSPKSQHLRGQAVDISIGGNNYNYDTTYNWAKELSSSIAYDQFLLEYRDTPDGRIIWLHFSYNPTGNRNQVLTLLNDKTNAVGLKKLA